MVGCLRKLKLGYRSRLNASGFCTVHSKHVKSKNFLKIIFSNHIYAQVVYCVHILHNVMYPIFTSENILLLSKNNLRN